ncbi:MAG: hypothetical protein HWN66_12605 [Candidatus Helarchaeota archaeon]|nr:hypothetical protein [Candidatus Helarchaeota archaeon]
MNCKSKEMKNSWILLVSLYWIRIGSIIIFTSKNEVSGFNITDLSTRTTYFHIENLTLAFIVCFISGLSISIVGIIFSYGLVFRSLFQVFYKNNIQSDIKIIIKDTIRRGYEIENSIRYIIYIMLFIIVFMSIGLGISLIIKPWGNIHYIVIKQCLLFLLVGITPVFVSIILALLLYPHAPLRRLLYVFNQIMNTSTEEGLNNKTDKNKR